MNSIKLYTFILKIFKNTFSSRTKIFFIFFAFFFVHLSSLRANNPKFYLVINVGSLII